MDYEIRDHMEHSLQITLTKEGTDLLTSAEGKFRLWKMAEKIRTCGRRRIDGGHNVDPRGNPVHDSSTDENHKLLPSRTASKHI